MKKNREKKRKKPRESFDFFEIDEHNLEKEWIAQPALFFNWARKLADAGVRLDQAKAELDVTKAELSRSIRDDPEAFGLDKVTEAAVTAAIPEQEDYKEAVKGVSKAKHEVDVYTAAVRALEHRKRALEKLVDLHGQNYFSTPRSPDKETKERIDEAGKQDIRRRKRKRPKE